MESNVIKYVHLEATHNLRAPSVIVPILLDKLRPASVVDVGCGIGTWLRVFQDLGVNKILGLDGSNVDKRQLKIDEKFFRAVDFRDPFQISEKYDLVLCLEVIEHLDECDAQSFIDLLTSFGDTIVFSGALPGQGGQNHLNEQWLTHWIEFFAAKGYKYYDLIRPLVWENSEVDFWYKQNIVVFSRKSLGTEVNVQYKNLVHPELLSIKEREIEILKQRLSEHSLWKVLKMCIKSLLKR
jgi:SAM-dependent methyltransferase